MASPTTALEVFAGVLVGGRGRRLGGVDKSQLRLGGQTLLERTLGVVQAVTTTVVLSGRSDPTSGSFQCVPDLRPGAGPLAGLEALLVEAPAPWCWLVACDMPYLSVDLFKRLNAARAELPEVDCVVPQTDHGWHPTCALYHRRVLADVQQRLDQGRLAMRGLVAGVRRCLVAVESPLSDALTNINRVEDLKYLQTRR